MRGAPRGITARRDFGNVVDVELNVAHSKVAELRIDAVDLVVRDLEEQAGPVVDVERVVRAVHGRFRQRQVVRQRTLQVVGVQRLLQHVRLIDNRRHRSAHLRDDRVRNGRQRRSRLAHRG